MTDETMAEHLTDALPELPDGEYGIIEIMGHRTLVGLVEEVQRFGANMMSIKPILRGQLLAPVYLNGSSIYMHTPCTKDQALRYAPQSDHALPTPVRCALPVAMLSSPNDRPGFYDDEAEFREVDEP